MELASYIDLYCERTAPGFWNEPLNAVSNGAFLAAAGWGWVVARRQGGPGLAEAVLIALAACIGIGSFLFHTFASGWAEIADVIPIWTFVACYVLTAIHHMTGSRFAKTARIGGIAAAIAVAVFWFSGDAVATGANDGQVSPLNGSLQYLPAVLAFAAFTVLSWWQRHPARAYIAGAAMVFTLSLAFRTIDLAVCSSFPIGSHFLWHILNGLMIGLLLVTMIRHIRPASEA